MTPWESATTFAPVPFEPGPPRPDRPRPQPPKPGNAGTVKPDTKAATILAAILAWEQASREPMPQAAAVVAAWRLDQPGLGLPGYAGRFPDSNRVIMELVKMTKRKLLARPKPLHYRLTPAGRAVAEALTARAA